MKRDENETLCWIMRWGWITWKWSLAFNNDDGKKLYNLFTKKNKKIKTNYHLLHLLHLTSTLPAAFSLCPCTLPWNRNQKTFKGKIFNYWPGPHSEIPNDRQYFTLTSPYPPASTASPAFLSPSGPSIPLPPSPSYPPPLSSISFALHFWKFKILY